MVRKTKDKFLAIGLHPELHAMAMQMAASRGMKVATLIRFMLIELWNKDHPEDKPYVPKPKRSKDKN